VTYVQKGFINGIGLHLPGERCQHAHHPVGDGLIYVDYERLRIEEFSENGGSIPHNWCTKAYGGLEL
jgi:hypothetical protein